MTKYWLNSEPGHNGTKRIADLKYFTSEKLTFQWQVAFEKFETEIKQQAREFWSLVLPRVYLSQASPGYPNAEPPGSAPEFSSTVLHSRWLCVGDQEGGIEEKTQNHFMSAS